MKRILFMLVILMITLSSCSSVGVQKPTIISTKIDEMPAQIQEINREGFEPFGYIYVFVEKVIDGDTLKVKYKKDEYKVRLLDVDTPESVKEGIPVQKFSKEASEFTKHTVLNKNVKLIFSVGLKDKYGRLLAYVVLNDGTFLNAQLVRKGYARAEILPPNTELQDYFYNLEEKAVQEKVGLWALPKSKIPFIKDEDGNYIPRYWKNGKT